VEAVLAADTLVYVDLPLVTHYWWVTKRLVKGLWEDPEGWPENSPLWSSTLAGYRVIPLCHRELTPRYRQLAAAGSPPEVAGRNDGLPQCNQAGACARLAAARTNASSGRSAIDLRR
jgi:hypothetical protein